METTTSESLSGDAGLQEGGAGGSSRTLLVLTALASVVVGVIIGGVIGWQVEKIRVEDDITNIRPIGTITAVTDDSFTIDLGADRGTRDFTLTDATAVETAEGGTAADLTEGAKVLVRGRNSEGESQAVEVIVLPDANSSGG